MPQSLMLSRLVRIDLSNPTSLSSPKVSKQAADARHGCPFGEKLAEDVEWHLIVESGRQIIAIDAHRVPKRHRRLGDERRVIGGRFQ